MQVAPLAPGTAGACLGACGCPGHRGPGTRTPGGPSQATMHGHFRGLCPGRRQGCAPRKAPRNLSPPHSFLESTPARWEVHLGRLSLRRGAGPTQRQRQGRAAGAGPAPAHHRGQPPPRAGKGPWTRPGGRTAVDMAVDMEAAPRRLGHRTCGARSFQCLLFTRSAACLAELNVW